MASRITLIPNLQAVPQISKVGVRDAEVSRKPHPAEELFTGMLREASLFDDPLHKVGSDWSVVERLIEYEK